MSNIATDTVKQTVAKAEFNRPYTTGLVHDMLLITNQNMSSFRLCLYNSFCLTIYNNFYTISICRLLLVVFYVFVLSANALAPILSVVSHTGSPNDVLQFVKCQNSYLLVRQIFTFHGNCYVRTLILGTQNVYRFSPYLFTYLHSKMAKN